MYTFSSTYVPRMNVGYALSVVLIGMICDICGLIRNQNVSPLLNYKPKWLVQCKLTDPQLNQCLNNFSISIYPELAKGIPDIGIDPYEPLHLDSIEISKGSGPVTLVGKLYNITVKGPANAKPVYTNLDIKKKRLSVGIFIPKLTIRSKYDLRGKILILPILGNGNANIVINNIMTHVKTHVIFPTANETYINDNSSQTPPNGKEILFIRKMSLNYTIDGLNVNFENLFNGNRRLGQSLNNFINQNYKEIVAELYDNIADNLSLIFTDLLNRFYSKIPTELWLTNENL